MSPLEQHALENDIFSLTCAQRLMDIVPNVMQAFREEMRNHRAADMSIPEFRALSYIQRYDGTTMTAVTKHVGLSKASLSKIVARLEQRQFVHRSTANDDKRHHSLHLTAHGKQILAEVERATLRSIADRLTHLKREDLQTVAKALDLLKPSFDV